jgi:hypothetical protein
VLADYAGRRWPAPTEGWPAWLWQIPYDARQHPQAVELRSVRDGANCQLFAAAVLELFGLEVPALRSSELWTDSRLVRTTRAALEPLDLVLFAAGESAYGAHVGVHIAEDQVLHLCAEAGHPAVWGYGDFVARARYRNLLGGLRVAHRSEGTIAGRGRLYALLVAEMTNDKG